MKLSFKEGMAGKIYKGRKGMRAEFVIDVACYSWKDLKKGNLEIDGKLIISGSPSVEWTLAGTLKIDVLKRKLIYEFQYGHRFENTFKGEKNVRFFGPLQFLETMTFLPGKIYYADGKKDHAYFRFRISKHLIPMILSFRLHLLDQEMVSNTKAMTRFLLKVLKHHLRGGKIRF